MTFHVGQKVVCVDVSNWDDADYYLWSYPRLKEIVTISGFTTGPCGELCVMLVEHLNDAPNDPYGGAFYAWRFRPIVEKKTDISFAHEILRKVSRKDRVRA